MDFSIYEEKQPEVDAVTCPGCGALFYPAPMICPNCNTRRDPSGVIHSRWEACALEGVCTLLTWTRVWALPEGYDDRFLMFGVVQFENGVRASGRLRVEKPAIGMTLIASPGVIKTNGDSQVYGLFFSEST